MCGLEPAFENPFLGWQVAEFPEIAFECGEAPACVGGYFFHGEVVHVVFVHEFPCVYFPRFGEVEEGGV